MAQRPLRSLVGMLRRAAGSEGEPTDGELLRLYYERSDQDAFARLVARHGPLVLGVCRRVVGDHHHAEDAFQATFLVLAGRASRLAAAESVAGFLHEVALRVGRKQRARLARASRRDREAALSRPESVAPPEEGLDEELLRLPAGYREALTLCYLRGLSLEEAAKALGCTFDALRGRLHRGKQLLRERLRLEPPVLTPVAPPAGLCEKTLDGLAAPGPVVSYLARGVLVSTSLSRAAWALSVAALLAVVAPLALSLGGERPARRGPAENAAPPAAKPKDGRKKAKRAEADPEPPAPPRVRELKVKEIPLALGDFNGVRVFSTAEEAERAGKASTFDVLLVLRAASKQVQFGREVLVAVGHRHDGPPLVVRYRVDGKKRQVEFFCQMPKMSNDDVLDDTLKIAGGFFAVPAGTKVKWAGAK
jgi:RNA polymerase sigma factor (sigma-70 family)